MDQLIKWYNHVDVSLYPAIIVLIAFLVLFPKLNRDDRWVAFTVLLYIFIDIITSIMSFYKITNLWIYNWVLILQFLMVMLTMVRKMKNKHLKIIMFAGCTLLIFAHLINLFFLQGFMGFANFTYIPICVWMAVCSFFYLKEQLEDIDIIPFCYLTTWFAFATLIDNAGAMPILSILGWNGILLQPYVNHLYDIVTWIYAIWYLIILTGLLWTKTSLRSVFYSR